MIELINLDKELFLFLNNLGSDKWDVFWQTITYRFTWIPLYALLLYLILKVYGWKYTLLILLMITLLISCTDQFTNLLKYSVKRFRPCRNPELYEHMRFANCQKNGRFGFTSAHASNHFALAVFVGSILHKRYAWLIYALLIWAAVIAYSRIYVGVHYPLDILCGAVIGIVFSLLILQLYKFLSRKYLKKNKLAQSILDRKIIH